MLGNFTIFNPLTLQRGNRPAWTFPYLEGGQKEGWKPTISIALRDTGS